MMAFMIEWLTTIPGILISLGVVLLVIAFIMFIIGLSKEKKQKKVEYNDKTEVMPVVNDIKTTEVKEVEPVIPMEPIKVEKPIVKNIEIKPIADEPIEIIPAEEINQDKVSMPEVNLSSIEPMVIEPIEVTPEKISNVDTNKMEIPIDLISDNAVEIAVEPEIKTENINTNYENTEHRTIYGGANPLDATQNLPKIDVHHEPYSGGTVVDERPVSNYSFGDNVVEIPDDVEEL